MWQALIPAVVSVIDKVLPDPQQAAEAKLRALELGQRGDLAQLDAEVRLALGQMEINGHHRGDQRLPHGQASIISIARTCSATRSARPFWPPLMRLVIVSKSPPSASALPSIHLELAGR